MHKECTPDIPLFPTQAKNPILVQKDYLNMFSPSNFDLLTLKSQCKLAFNISPITIPTFKDGTIVLPFYVIMASHFYILNEKSYVDHRDGPARWHATYVLQTQPRPPEPLLKSPIGKMESPRLMSKKIVSRKIAVNVAMPIIDRIFIFGLRFYFKSEL